MQKEKVMLEILIALCNDQIPHRIAYDYDGRTAIDLINAAEKLTKLFMERCSERKKESQ